MNKQLYKFIPDLKLPHLIRYNESTGEYITRQSTEPGFFSIKWPNGMHCLIAEMYLMDKSNYVKISKSDGGTVGSYAGHLSHLIRYCFKSKRDFSELHSFDFDSLIIELAQEKDKHNNLRRNNNTIKTIISTCVNFLVWIQNNIITDRNIIGVDKDKKRYQIKLVTKIDTTSKGHTRKHDVFPNKLPKSITQPKEPISTISIKLLWDALCKNKNNAKCSNKLKGKFSKKQQLDHLEYMQKRRELQLYLLESTGLRPQELINISVSHNMSSLEKATILLPTLKTRLNSRESSRLIPIDRAIAMKIQVFIGIYRKRLIKRLITSDIVDSNEDIDDVIYLNAENGKAVKPDAAYQEFLRLTKKANITQKNCQSMYRHRFITNMVKLHLISFMDKTL